MRYDSVPHCRFKALAKRGHVVGATLLCLRMVLVRGKTWQLIIVARRADTGNVPEDFQKHFCVRQTCCARGKTSQHLGNILTSAMFPPPCRIPCHFWPLLFQCLVLQKNESIQQKNKSKFLTGREFCSCNVSLCRTLTVLRYCDQYPTLGFPFIGQA